MNTNAGFVSHLCKIAFFLYYFHVVRISRCIVYFDFLLADALIHFLGLHLTMRRNAGFYSKTSLGLIFTVRLSKNHSNINIFELLFVLIRSSYLDLHSLLRPR